jgi:5-hydroxyisourate hydrolase
VSGSLTLHVLDTARGRAAAGVAWELWRLEPSRRLLKVGQTNGDGRTDEPLLAGALETGRYEIVYRVGAYFRAEGVYAADPPFLDEVPIRFGIADPGGRYHVPLLVSPWSYATYRGS